MSLTGVQVVDAEQTVTSPEYPIVDDQQAIGHFVDFDAEGRDEVGVFDEWCDSAVVGNGVDGTGGPGAEQESVVLGIVLDSFRFNPRLLDNDQGRQLG